ncbi:MAG: metal-sensing transcriptional repressor [Spirochaetes bacterium]|nr:metal-sensing transcriptional repressor [Spirochaetota bacterium]
MGDNIENKKAHHSTELKDDLVKRLNRIEGQVRGVNKMIQGDVYCDNILNQIESIHSALSSARNILLEAHINSCIRESIEKGDNQIISELMITLKRMMK